jgi:hypothetical protein
MANNNNPNVKRPGEKPPGKHHYNPGNMSGKTVEAGKKEAEQNKSVDRLKSRDEVSNKDS